MEHAVYVVVVVGLFEICAGFERLLLGGAVHEVPMTSLGSGSAGTTGGAGRQVLVVVVRIEVREVPARKGASRRS